MNNAIQEQGPVSMVVLPQSALEDLKAGLAELKQMIQGKAVEEAGGQWLESEAARKMLGISQKTWQTYRDNRVLPFSQFGRKIYVKRADIEAFLESKMIKPHTSASAAGAYN